LCFAIGRFGIILNIRLFFLRILRHQHTAYFQNLALDLLEQFLVVIEEDLGVFAALTELHVAVAEPGALLFDDVVFAGEVDHVGGAADAAVEHDVEHGLAEGRGDFVLNYAGLDLVAGHAVALLDRGDAADVDTDRAVEFQGATAGGGLGIAEHDADLLA